MRPESKQAVSADAFSVAVTTTALTREVTDMLQILPAQAAASILLMIFDTVEAVQINKDECTRLAYRCYSLLSDIRGQMEGRWEASPPSLVRSFQKLEQILLSIHDFMKEEADSKWHSRLLRKRTIERDIADFTVQLDDAMRSFEMSILISLQHTVGDGAVPQSSNVTQDALSTYPAPDEEELVVSFPHLSLSRDDSACSSGFTERAHCLGPCKSSPLIYESDSGTSPSHVKEANSDSFHSPSESQLVTVLQGTSPCLDELLLATTAVSLPVIPARNLEPDSVEAKDIRFASKLSPKQMLLCHDIPRHHQSQIRILGRSRMKEGWWAGCVQAELGTETVLIKRYEGGKEEYQRWIWDVTILTQSNHRCLPTLVGLSHEGASTPFILLKDEGSLALQGAVKDKIKRDSVEACVQFLIRLYLDIFELCQYLQQQSQLSESQVQDYLENASFRATSDGRIYVGPPSLGHSRNVSVRRWRIVQSVHDIIQQVLAKAGAVKDASLRQKITEVTISVSNYLVKVTNDEPCPDWLRLLAETTAVNQVPT